MAELNLADLAYAAGIIDGEGCINLRTRRYGQAFCGVIFVTMCEPQAVMFLHDAFGGTITIRRLDHPKHRPQNVWRIAGHQAVQVCEQILPFLRVKKRQAQNLIELQKISSKIGDCVNMQRRNRATSGRYWVHPALQARAEALCEEQRRLNRRGVHEDIPNIKSTAPPISAIGNMLLPLVEVEAEEI